MKSNNSKLEVWWFDDDDFFYRYFSMKLKNEYRMLKDRINVTRFTSLAAELEREGTPDIIIIDTTTMTDVGTYVGNWDRYAMTLLRKFAEKHVSSQFVISSAVGYWAQDFVRELQQTIEELAPVKVIECGDIAVLDYLTNFIRNR